MNNMNMVKTCDFSILITQTRFLKRSLRVENQHLIVIKNELNANPDPLICWENCLRFSHSLFTLLLTH